MKNILIVLALVPVLAYSQSKRKKRQMEEKANIELVNKLKSHIGYLADDQLEGRRAGSKGEDLARQYIITQYQQMQLEPAGENGYVQAFEINDGKHIDDVTMLKADGKTLSLMEDYIPLAFSANKSISGRPAIALSETGQPWFKDLKDVLEENKTNPHFDVEEEIKKITDKVASKGATALFLYNSSDLVDNVQFNRKDRSEAVKIPVLFLTKKGYSKYFSDEAASIPVELNIHFSESRRTAHNIIGFINNHAANTVIIGAHYDHLGFGEDKNALDTGHIIHNGADDNASGTAAVIELARMLKKKAPAGNNYLVMNFSGEEMGLLGSKYWLDHPTHSITANYMINFDMVGRYDTAHKLTIGGFGTSPVWATVLSEKSNLLIKFDTTGSGPSDHAAFYRKDIPVLFLFTGSHPDYHKASDDWQKINYDAEKDIVKLVYHIIETTDSKGKLAFTKTAEPKTGEVKKMKVTLGVIPDYGFTGTGLRIDGVSPGKIGEKIGLQAGDILLQLGDHKFTDIYSYMNAMGNFDKGDKTKLRVKRGNEELTFDVEF